MKSSVQCNIDADCIDTEVSTHRNMLSYTSTVDLFVATTVKRPRCKREFGYGAFQVSGRLDDSGRHGGRKLLSFFASFERTVVHIVASKLNIMTGQAICSWLKHKR